MTDRGFWVGFLVIAGLSATGGALASAAMNVTQRNRAFSTSQVQIARTESIRFSNDDLFVHQIYIDAPSYTFESDEQNPGETIDVPFPKPGVFTVLCHIHPKMHLSVDVR